MSAIQALENAPLALGGANVSHAIRERRALLGVSQAELAARVGRSRKWVSELESGATSPGIDGVSAAAEALGLELTVRRLDEVRASGASLPGSFDRPNEDSWGAEGPLAWVIDGATQPGETIESVDARSYVAALGEAVRARAGDTRATLAEILAGAIEAASTWPAAEAGPAATVAMVRRSGDGFEWLVLGDAGIMLRHGARGAVTLVTDDRLAQVAVAEREARRAARASGSDAAEQRELSARLYRAELAMRNRSGGYWVASGDPEAAHHALQGYADTLGPVLLMSDGMLDALGSASPWRTTRTAFRSWVETAPEEAVARVRDMRASIQGAKVDDATLVVAR